MTRRHRRPHGPWIAGWLTVLLLLGVKSQARALEWDVNGDLGYQLGVGNVRPLLQRNRPYAILGIRYKPAGLPHDMSAEFTASARAWYDIGSGGAQADARSLTAQVAAQHGRIVLGMQFVSWGESFGIHIADIVNPRDLRDILLNDLNWMRVPVLGANVQVITRWFHTQLLLVPIAENNVLPSPGSVVDFFPGTTARAAPPSFHFGRDAEFGGRIGSSWDFGLNAAALFYQHKNRNVVYEVLTTSSLLTPVVETIRTVGLTFNQSWQQWALHGDIIMHLDTPMQDYQTLAVSRAHALQAILGLDMITDDYGTYGLQAHSESWGRNRYLWLSARALQGFLNDALTGELFLFKGIGNSDLWLQAQVHWRPVTALDLSLRGDILGPELQAPRGMLAAVRTRRRLYTWLSWRF